MKIDSDEHSIQKLALNQSLIYFNSNSLTAKIILTTQDTAQLKRTTNLIILISKY